MRIPTALPLLLAAAGGLAACDVNNDAANDQMTLEYDEQKIRNAAAATARTAREVGSGVGNVAASAGRAIENEVGDVDVDLDVTRNRGGAADQADPATNRAN
jgi:hypothetical protein